MDQQEKELPEALSDAEKVLIGIGGEWKLGNDGRDVHQHCLGDQEQRELREAYAVLRSLARNKGYYVITTVTDGAIYDTDFSSGRVVAPCENIHWRQCSRVCTKDIWEEGKMPDDICPHCKVPLTDSTIDAETYIEEGCLSRWEVCKKWQTGILNRRLVILELGERFEMSAVIHWPFEKIGFFDQESVSYRIRKAFYQMPKEMGERAAGVQANSVASIRGLIED